MKNKGFTLVELLAVIVLLAVIAMIAVPAITGLLKSSRESLSDSQRDTIVLAAKNWASDMGNLKHLPKQDTLECVIVSLTRLQQDNYLDLEIKDPKTGEVINNAIWVKINYKLKENGNPSKQLEFTLEEDIKPDGCIEPTT